MIDLLDIKLELKHTPFGKRRIVENECNAGIHNIKFFSKTLRVNGAPVIVTSSGDGSVIHIRGCPLKPLQGHNIFGTNQVKKLGYRLITDVLAELGITATNTQHKAWLRGEFDIDEIHLTHRFPVYAGERIMQIVSHILRYSSMTLKPAVIKRGVGVELTAPHSLATWNFYNKLLEFMDKRKKEHAFLGVHVGEDAEDARALLAEIARHSIRAELKLSDKYLIKHGLSQGHCWSVAQVKEVFLHELGLLNLGSIPAIQQMPVIYSQIDDAKLRSVMMLWANGEDLSNHYGRTTYGKYRKQIRDQFGIDIQFDQPVNKPARLQLSAIFDPSEMLVGFPKSLRDYPELAFK